MVGLRWTCNSHSCCFPFVWYDSVQLSQRLEKCGSGWTSLTMQPRLWVYRCWKVIPAILISRPSKWWALELLRALPMQFGLSHTSQLVTQALLKATSICICKCAKWLVRNWRPTQRPMPREYLRFLLLGHM